MCCCETPLPASGEGFYFRCRLAPRAPMSVISASSSPAQILGAQVLMTLGDAETAVRLRRKATASATQAPTEPRHGQPDQVQRQFSRPRCPAGGMHTPRPRGHSVQAQGCALSVRSALRLNQGQNRPVEGGKPVPRDVVRQSVANNVVEQAEHQGNGAPRSQLCEPTASRDN